MNRFVLITACSLLALPAFAATTGETTGTNSTLGTPTTKEFVQEAAITDMFEIQSSKLAANKLSGSGKDFADQMIADHTKTTTELTEQAKADNIPISGTMDSLHQGMLDSLSKLDGKEFRNQYFTDQVNGHKDAVSLFERYGKGGDNAKLKEWAAKTLPTLKHHLEMAVTLVSG